MESADKNESSTFNEVNESRLNMTAENVKFGIKHNIFEHFTTLSQICVLFYVFLVIYLCFAGEFVFFTWHPLLLSIGWMFLMTEAILTISKDNIVFKGLSKVVKVRWHWILQTIALILIIIGFIIVVINKNRLDKSHFKSWHALFGFIGIICSIPTCLNGTAALFKVNLRHYIKPKINKLIHISSGALTFIFGGLSLLLSVYTHWFERHTSGNGFIFCCSFVTVFIAVTWTLMRPIVSCLSQVKHMG